ncbi:MAG TPA: hypothetical protein VFU89_06135 [Rhabdochlamydiaceae bacterium]|nr:hypothetical protein [Rhabdochlamydiaceae bacterium]
MATLETVTFGKTLTASLAHIPSITCVSTQAMIDKTYLKWLDIAKLLNAFPKHIQLVGDMVVFQGPVAIVLPWSPTKK